MSELGKYFVPTDPSSIEEGTYSRHSSLFYWLKRSFHWKWKFAGISFATWPAVRALIDGVPATPFLQPATNLYDFAVTDVLDGHHLFGAETPGGLIVVSKPFVVNSTGAPLLVQNPWIAHTRFDDHVNLAPGAMQITYPGQPVTPKRYPLKPRVAEPYSTRLTKKQRWARRVHTNTTQGMNRRFAEIPTLDVVVDEEQPYFYIDAIGEGFLRPPKRTLRDGPIGVGTYGFCYKFILRDDGGIFGLDPSGRLTLTSPAGVIKTLFGWRIKPGVLKAHTGVLNTQYMYRESSALGYRPQDQAHYDSKWEEVGDMSQVPDPKRLRESWGFAVAERDAGGAITVHDGHEFWICDTLNHRIIWINHWTAHAPAAYAPAQFPPQGYVSPDAPTGQAQAYPFIIGGPGNPLCDQPWDCTVNAAEGKLYWSNFGNGSICRANLDGSNPEVVVASSVQPTDGQLGVSARLTGSSIPPGTLRANWVRDGAPGVASCVRPQGLEIDSDGNLVWAERYTFVLRRLDFAAGLVTTIANIGNATGDEDKTDIALRIDVEGTCGPKDDIFVNAWKNGDYRYAKAGGAAVERPFFQSGTVLRNGPHDKTEGPGYAWAFDVWKGRIVANGSAGATQFIEITKRLPTDPADPDVVKWKSGKDAFNNGASPPMTLPHGLVGEGELGFPTIDALGAMDDAALRAYAAPWMSAAQIDAFVYWVRWSNVDHDFSAVATDTTPPMQPLQALTIVSIQDGGTMYQVQMHGTAANDPDIAKVRFYLEGSQVSEQAVAAGAGFDVSFQTPDSGQVSVAYSYVDAAGNESGKFTQQVDIPDRHAPDAPADPLQLVSVVWAA